MFRPALLTAAHVPYVLVVVPHLVPAELARLVARQRLVRALHEDAAPIPDAVGPAVAGELRIAAMARKRNTCQRLLASSWWAGLEHRVTGPISGMDWHKRETYPPDVLYVKSSVRSR